MVYNTLIQIKICYAIIDFKAFMRGLYFGISPVLNWNRKASSH